MGQWRGILLEIPNFIKGPNYLVTAPTQAQYSGNKAGLETVSKGTGWGSSF